MDKLNCNLMMVFDVNVKAQPGEFSWGDQCLNWSLIHLIFDHGGRSTRHRHQTSFFPTMTQHSVFQTVRKTQQLVVNDKEKHKENPHEPENVETHHKGFICYQDRWILMFFWSRYQLLTAALNSSWFKSHLLDIKSLIWVCLWSKSKLSLYDLTSDPCDFDIKISQVQDYS